MVPRFVFTINPEAQEITGMDIYMIILSEGWQLHIDWKPVIICVIVVIAAFVVSLPFLIARAARNHGRSGLFWFFFSLILSPLIAILLLLALGDTDEKRRERIISEERFRSKLNERSSDDYSDNNNIRLQKLLEQSRRL